MLEHIKTGSNLVFVARHDVLTVSFSEMQKQMNEVLERAKLLDESK